MQPERMMGSKGSFGGPKISTVRRRGRRVFGNRNGRGLSDDFEDRRRALLTTLTRREVNLDVEDHRTEKMERKHYCMQLALQVPASGVFTTPDDWYDTDNGNPCTNNCYDDGNDCTDDYCDDGDPAWELQLLAAAQPNHQSHWGWGKHKPSAREAAPIRHRPSPLYTAIHISGDPDDIHFAYADL